MPPKNPLYQQHINNHVALKTVGLGFAQPTDLDSFAQPTDLDSRIFSFYVIYGHRQTQRKQNSPH